MNMKMNYIIIKKEEVPNIRKKENIIIISSSPMQLIKNNFENFKVEKLPEDEEMSRSNWNGSFEINNYEVEFNIREYLRQKISYLSIIFDRKNINEIEKVDSKINNIMQKEYIVITSYDSISEYYCNKAYKKLNNFERKLRSLMFYIYTFAYGSEYYNKSFSDEKKGKLNSRQNKLYKTDSEKIEQVKQSLYELEYCDIEELLFTPKWTDDEREELINKIKTSKMSNQELIKEVKNIRPKSDWERLFLPQIGKINGIEDSIEEVRKIRNQVAHCRFFKKDEYEKISKLLRKLNRQINKALDVVMTKDFQEENLQYAYDNIIDSLNYFQVYINEIKKAVIDVRRTFEKFD